MADVTITFELSVDPKRTVPVFVMGEWPERGYGRPGGVLSRSGEREYADTLAFNCPGCGRFGSIRCTHPKDVGGRSWDIVKGSLREPKTLTLAPPIRCVGCCGWHGYLTDGVFRPV